MQAYKPKEIGGHCANCGNHGAVWSCPPHAFDPVEFLQRYQHVYVIIGTVYLQGFETQAESIDYYYRTRTRINRAVLACEKTAPGSVSLFAGHCDACETCTRTLGNACVHPEKCRYSLESLGLKVSLITEHHFGESLQWAAGKAPDKLLTVPALLTREEVNPEELRTLLQTQFQGS
jgi:predicted metal-binding protein